MAQAHSRSFAPLLANRKRQPRAPVAAATPKTQSLELVDSPWTAPLVIGLVALAMLWWIWARSADVLIDFGRELYVPWQLSEGKALYTDIAYFNGPLSPYFNALLFRIFGPGIAVLAVANAVIFALFLYLTYQLLLALGNRFVAFVGTLTVVLVFGFGHYGNVGNYNFIYPYSHEMTHGLVLSFAAIWCFWTYLSRERLAALAGAGLLTGACLLTKPEISVALVAALLAGLVAASVYRVHAGRLITMWGTFLGLAMVAPLASFGLLSLAMPAHEAWLGTLGGFQYVTNRALTALPYYRGTMGTLDLGDNVQSMAIWAGLYAALTAVAWFDARRLPPEKRTVLAPLTAFGIVALLASWFFLTFWYESLRPLPLVMAGGAAWSGWTLVRSHDAARRPLVILRLMMFVFALALTMKVVLKVQVTHYGFVLALPAMLMLLVIVLAWLPDELRRRGGAGHIFQAAWLGGLAVFVAACLFLNDNFLNEKNYQVARGADDLYAFATPGKAVDATLKKLTTELRPGETLVVMPEGVMINYLARIDNPTPHVYFMPGEMLMFGEDAMLATLVAHPPDLIAVVPKDLSEFGYQGFGLDLGVKIWTWVKANYQPIEPEPRDRGFHIRLMRRVAKK